MWDEHYLVSAPRPMIAYRVMNQSIWNLLNELIHRRKWNSHLENNSFRPNSRNGNILYISDNKLFVSHDNLRDWDYKSLEEFIEILDNPPIIIGGDIHKYEVKFGQDGSIHLGDITLNKENAGQIFKRWQEKMKEKNGR